MDTEIGKPFPECCQNMFGSFGRTAENKCTISDASADRGDGFRRSSVSVHERKIATDINTCVGLMSDAELIGIAATILDELKRRSEKRNASAETVVISQNNRVGAIVRFEDGTPVDRAAWFYLPFLPGMSKYFQPMRRGSVSVYREALHEGKVLMITKGPDVVVRVRVGGEQRKIEAGGATIEGHLTLIPDRQPDACNRADLVSATKI